MSHEDEIKTLIMTAVWNAMANNYERVGIKSLPHGDLVDEFMELVADDVYDAISGYIK